MGVSLDMKDHRIGIVGGGLGGLSAAIYLQHAGFEVTLFEANERVGGRASRIEAQGFRFDTGPSLLNYPWVFEEIFQAVGRRMEDYLTLLPVDPSIQFLWPDGTRFSLSSNLQKLRAEISRLEPGSDPGLCAFLADAESKYRFSFDKLVRSNVDNPIRWFGRLTPAEMLQTAVWRSLDSELGRFFKSRYIREALGSYAMYLGGSPWDLPGLFSILPYGELAYGLWLPRGGVYALVEALQRLALEVGVKIETGCRVTRILTRDRQVRGLRFSDESEREFQRVVSNVDVPHSRTGLMDDERVRQKGERRNRRLRMTPGVMTFYWGLEGRVKGLKHHTIFLPRDTRATFRDLAQQRLSPDPAFYVSIPSDTDPSVAPPGCTTVFILVPTPLQDECTPEQWRDAVPRLRSTILERLASHGIAISDRPMRYEQVWLPSDWGCQYGLYRGSAFGAAHTLFQLGPFRDRNYDPDIQGLYYVGAGVPPGTGMPMVVLGGKMTAERILSHVR